MWMYDHLQKLFSTEVSIEKYRPAKSNLVSYFTTGQFYLQIKVSKAILVQLLNLVGGIEIKLC